MLPRKWSSPLYLSLHTQRPDLPLVIFWGLVIDTLLFHRHQLGKVDVSCVCGEGLLRHVHLALLHHSGRCSSPAHKLSKEEEGMLDDYIINIDLVCVYHQNTKLALDYIIAQNTQKKSIMVETRTSPI